MRTARFLSAAMLGVVLTGAQWALAQTVYKLIDKNGKITYSEEKPKNFDGQVIPMNIDPNANTATMPKATFDRNTVDGTQRVQKAKPNTGPSLGDAKDRLEKAKAALQNAKDNPTAEERMMVGKVGGGVRYVESEDYQKKIQQLEQDVKDAEDNLARAEKGG
ncbi:MAG: hypothetical protein WA190_07045 [Usitatibacter sp.]